MKLPYERGTVSKYKYEVECRVEAEAIDLVEKISKIAGFTEANKIYKVTSDEHLALLQEQRAIMEQYIDVLERRLALFEEEHI